MTNYNDGKWHGWNGGECPVHPATLVQVQHGIRSIMLASHYDWSHPDDILPSREPIIAFRVVKEHREPREWWVNVYGDDVAGMHTSKEDAEDIAGPARTECIRVREVLE